MSRNQTHFCEDSKMSFSPEWEHLYASGAHHSVWPWSELISLIMRHARPHQSEAPVQVLEIGCGVGANIPLVQWFGGVFHGVDNSASALASIRQRYGDKIELAQADFCEDIPFIGPFDIVIDRASLTHNFTSGIELSLDMVEKRLAPGGVYVGVHWFSTDCDDFKLGEPTEDPHVRKGYSRGDFAGVGQVHFADQACMEHLFSNFSIEVLDHVISEAVKPERQRLGWWNIVAKKKNT
ncbi:class I SAM-dependent methyltransferase [Thalassospira xiamenensis]|uniref:class I SAM-dependent methyltransferase n=1 Tax=Thalassospira xiamenensis TaxID=220697 RepID=UPI003AA8ADF6